MATTTVERLGSVSDRHAKQRQTVIEKLIRLLLGLWGGYRNHDDVDISTGLAAASADLVESATKQVRTLERAYLGTVLRDLGVTPGVIPAPVNAYPRANVSPTEVYRRPVDDFIWARRNGLSFDQATAASIDRLQKLAEADLMAAERDEADVVYSSQSKVLGYRRVIHPELSKDGTCGLCLAASHNRYSVGDLLPLHNGCNCDTLPITTGDDPGFRLNQDDLKKIYAATGGSTAAEDLLNIRATVNEHGELGPVLVKQGDHFRSPEEAGRPPYKVATPAEMLALRTSERDDLAKQLEQTQARYDAMPTAEPNSAENAKRVAVFVAMKRMRERISSIDAFLRTLPQ